MFARFRGLATAPFPLGDENQRLAILAELDRLPVNHRTDIRRFLIDGLEKTRDVPNNETVWRQRRFVSGLEKVHLAYGVCSQFADVHRDIFGYWLQLRHYDHLLVRGDGIDLTTVGVLLTPRHDGHRPFDTTMIAVRGQLDFSDEELRAFREAWPNSD